MPTMSSQNVAAGRPFALTQALSVFQSGGAGVDVSMQLHDKLDEERKKVKEGRPSDPEAYGGLLSGVGVLGGLR